MHTYSYLMNLEDCSIIGNNPGEGLLFDTDYSGSFQLIRTACDAPIPDYVSVTNSPGNLFTIPFSDFNTNFCVTFLTPDPTEVNTPEEIPPNPTDIRTPEEKPSYTSEISHGEKTPYASAFPHFLHQQLNQHINGVFRN